MGIPSFPSRVKKHARARKRNQKVTETDSDSSSSDEETESQEESHQDHGDSEQMEMQHNTNPERKDEIHWRTIDNDLITSLATTFENDLDIQQAFNMVVNSLNKGKYRVTMPGRGELSERKNDYFDGILRRLSVKLLYNLYCFGFAAWGYRVLPNGEREPYILDLLQCKVEFHANHDDTRLYKFTRNDTKSGSLMGNTYKWWESRMQSDEEVIPDLIIMEWPNHEPGHDGRLRSIMTLVLKEQQHERVLMQADEDAWKRLAKPALVAQPVRQSFNPNNLSKSFEAGFGGGVDSDDTATDTAKGVKSTPGSGSSMGSAMSDFANACTRLQIPPDLVIQRLMSPQTERAPVPDLQMLPQNTELVNPTQPVGPAQHLLAVMNTRQQRVFNLFGVYTPSLSGGTKSASKSGGKSDSSGASSASVNPDTDKRFNESQKQLKLMILGMMRDGLMHCERDKYVLEYRQEIAATNTPHDPDEEMEATDIDVQLTAMPESTDVLALYEKGWLKFDATAELLAGYYGLSLDIFNSEEERAEQVERENELVNGSDDEGEGEGEEKSQDFTETVTTVKKKNLTGTKETSTVTKKRKADPTPSKKQKKPKS